MSSVFEHTHPSSQARRWWQGLSMAGHRMAEKWRARPVAAQKAPSLLWVNLAQSMRASEAMKRFLVEDERWRWGGQSWTQLQLRPREWHDEQIRQAVVSRRTSAQRSLRDGLAASRMMSGSLDGVLVYWRDSQRRPMLGAWSLRTGEVQSVMLTGSSSDVFSEAAHRLMGWLKRQ